MLFFFFSYTIPRLCFGWAEPMWCVWLCVCARTRVCVCVPPTFLKSDSLTLSLFSSAFLTRCRMTNKCCMLEWGAKQGAYCLKLHFFLFYIYKTVQKKERGSQYIQTVMHCGFGRHFATLLKLACLFQWPFNAYLGSRWLGAYPSMHCGEAGTLERVSHQLTMQNTAPLNSTSADRGIHRGCNTDTWACDARVTRAGSGVVAHACFPQGAAAQRPVGRGNAWSCPHLPALPTGKRTHTPLRPLLSSGVTWRETQECAEKG